MCSITHELQNDNCHILPLYASSQTCINKYTADECVNIYLMKHDNMKCQKNTLY